MAQVNLNKEHLTELGVEIKNAGNEYIGYVGEVVGILSSCAQTELIASAYEGGKTLQKGYNSYAESLEKILKEVGVLDAVLEILSKGSAVEVESKETGFEVKKTNTGRIAL